MTELPESEQSQDWGRKGLRLLFALACVIIVLAGMKAAAGILMPIAFAFFLAALSYPVMRWLIRCRIPHPVAMGLTLALNVGVLVGLINAGISLVISFQRDFRDVYVFKLREYANQAGAWLEEKGVQGAKQQADQMLDWTELTKYIGNLDVIKSVGSALGTTFGTLAAIFAGAVMVIILMAFILLEARGTKSRVQAVSLAGGPDLGHLLDCASDVQKYLTIKTAISALTGILAGFWCWLFDLNYPLLWAIIAFLFNFIPAVGSAAASIPAIIEALVVQGGGGAIGIAIGYGLINFCLDNFLQPSLLGRRFGISPLVIILSVIFWGWLWGPIGMFLAVPLTMVGKVLIDHSEEFRWLSVAMSKKTVRKGEVRLSDFDLALNEEEMVGGGASTEPPRT